jgi:hypothetical protein
MLLKKTCCCSAQQALQSFIQTVLCELRLKFTTMLVSRDVYSDINVYGSMDLSSTTRRGVCH